MFLASILRQERAKQGKSFRDFSKKLGIPIATLHGWENGVPPRLTKSGLIYLRKIKGHFGLSWEYIFEGKDKAIEKKQAHKHLEEAVRILKSSGLIM